jgi:hypothetical protein
MGMAAGNVSPVISIRLDSRHLASADDAVSFMSFLFLEIRNRLIASVTNQSLAKSWAPLSKAYAAHKVRYGLSPGMWVATGRLINSLRLHTSSGPSFVSACVFCSSEQHHNGVPMWMIAKYLEYGTRLIPPRPLFRPIAESVLHDMPRLIKLFYSGLTPSLPLSLST